MSITGEAYGKYLGALYQVADTERVTIENEEELKEFQSDAAQKHLKVVKFIKLEEVAQTTQEYVLEFLVAYQAAKQSNNPDVAILFLGKWVDDVHTNLHGVSSQGRQQQSNTLDEKIKLAIRKTKWPRAINAEEFRKNVSDRTQDLMVQELVNCKYPVEGMPAYAHALMGLVRTDPLQAYIIGKYEKHLINTSITGIETTSDEVIRLYLRRFTCLKILNLKGAKELTAACLSEGHRALESVDITDTALKPSDFPKGPGSKFPALKEVIQPKSLNVVEFNDNQAALNMPWSELQKKIQEADHVKIKDRKEFEGTLFSRLKKFLSRQGIDMIFALNDYYKKQDVFAHSFEVDIYKNLLQCWKELKTFDGDLAKHISNLLMDRSIAKREPMQEINDAIFSVFIKKEDKQVHWHTVSTYLAFSQQEIIRARSLFLFMMTRPSRLASFSSQMLSALEQIEDRLFESKSTEGYRSLDVETYEFLQEMYTTIAISYDGVEPDVHFQCLKSPNKPYTNPSAIYAAAVPFSLACGFVHPNQKEGRRKFYDNLIKNFGDYRTAITYYPLAKLVLGTLTEKDIPEHDNNCMLRPKFLKHQGLLAEDFDEEYKIEIFNALVSGQLGVITPDLTEALVALQTREGLSIEWKNRIARALDKLNTKPTVEIPSAALNPPNPPKSEELD